MAFLVFCMKGGPQGKIGWEPLFQSMFLFRGMSFHYMPLPLVYRFSPTYMHLWVASEQHDCLNSPHSLNLWYHWIWRSRPDPCKRTFLSNGSIQMHLKQWRGRNDPREATAHQSGQGYKINPQNLIIHIETHLRHLLISQGMDVATSSSQIQTMGYSDILKTVKSSITHTHTR